MKFIILIFIFSINSFAQNEYVDLVKLKDKSITQYENAVSDSIKKLSSSDLNNFFYHITLEDPNALKPHNLILIQKLRESKWAFDVYLVTNVLIDQNYNRIELSKVLTDKKTIWDKGNWSQKFWKLITENNLNVETNVGFSVDKNGEKRYEVVAFINDIISKGEIGNNPAVIINGDFQSYKAGDLIKLLNSLKIKDMHVLNTTKDGPRLFGKQGIDGVLSVTTE